ncbi:YtxH domain-containing protein [Niabella ginsengisoli]|uniref:YtxH domain-containing protein n=1 Tax=Niabella ginsengisoli TaxID=522298 RepID=A0ABS9SNX0_9BACT|nr:YtxH domain-containing protein [Niabella ginsengisoli]MCH5600055.1 YtxH domain-containing protein [Niabella ginsengisoli]
MNKLLTGFALGLLVGVLYAPEKGTYTRKRISDKGNDLKDQFADFIDNIAGKFEHTADEVEDYANMKTENIRSEAI